ncbi:MAG: hypothetical protein D6701_06730 [Gemmatimonadetes bacterium]|nr:MAG: hypothetical protein D6701_06730 [Gemmatimonadota bacterium]
MGKIFLLLIFALGAALYFPSSRQVVFEKAAPVLDPVLRWSAKGEMREIVRDLEQYDAIHRKLPTPREWDAWLAENFQGDGARDPWGTVYQYRVWRDSFWVSSAGPDRQPGTSDDFRLFELRSRH